MSEKTKTVIFFDETLKLLHDWGEKNGFIIGKATYDELVRALIEKDRKKMPVYEVTEL